MGNVHWCVNGLAMLQASFTPTKVPTHAVETRDAGKAYKECSRQLAILVSNMVKPWCPCTYAHDYPVQDHVTLMLRGRPVAPSRVHSGSNPALSIPHPHRRDTSLLDSRARPSILPKTPLRTVSCSAFFFACPC